MKYTIPFIVIICSLQVSCSLKKDSARPLDEATLIHFCADLLIIQEENKILNLDSLTFRKRTDSLYSTYHFNREEVTAKMAEYNKDATKWKEFYEKVSTRLDTLKSLSLRSLK